MTNNSVTNITTTASTHTLTSPELGTVEVSHTERGHGHPFLLLHGGAGPQSVSGFADLLATTEHARVITPTHPGFGGTSRPDALEGMAALAKVYSLLLDELDLCAKQKKTTSSPGNQPCFTKH